MPYDLKEARRFIQEHGIEATQDLFRESLDLAIQTALTEEFERRADSFNGHQREVMYSFEQKRTLG